MSKDKTYTTIQGDMWDKIAHEQMGSTSRDNFFF